MSNRHNPSDSTLALGLYIHVPFCSQVCHYCDFAKTSNFSSQHTLNYFEFLARELTWWIERLEAISQKKLIFETVFLGGGTPGLFTQEYAQIFSIIQSRLKPSAEITLETNPEACVKSNLRIWKNIGFNRISIGAQSLDDGILKHLTRTHIAEDVHTAVSSALSVFENVNVDFIYGITGQTKQQIDADIEFLSNYQVPHGSFYLLTIEPGTPFARKIERGKMQIAKDEVAADNYDFIAQKMRERGYQHIEVSNWSKSGFEPQHNMGYWLGKHYLGVGTGAHGYLPIIPALLSSTGRDQPAIVPGFRYAYDKDFRKALRSDRWKIIAVEEKRTLDQWVDEMILCSVRTAEGVPIKYIETVAQKEFQPSEKLLKGKDEGLCQWNEERFFLSESQWICETAWALELIRSFS